MAPRRGDHRDPDRQADEKVDPPRQLIRQDGRPQALQGARRQQQEAAEGRARLAVRIGMTLFAGLVNGPEVRAVRQVGRRNNNRRLTCH
jgi:hypothetical protein